MATALAACGQEFDPLRSPKGSKVLSRNLKRRWNKLFARKAKENTEKFKKHIDDHLD